MTSNRMRRIAKELADIQSDSSSRIYCQSMGDDMTHIRASFMGPPDTAYEGGTYMIDVKIPDGYPFRPPVMKFDTKLWHPNVSSQTGAICLDTLGSAWSPVLTIKSALLSLQSLLSTPEPRDPQDAEVAQMLMRDPEEFYRVAREWAVKYAGAPRKKTIDSSSGGGSSSSFPMSPSTSKNKKATEAELLAKYDGYNKDLIDRFVVMGFDVERVVAAFNFVGIDKLNGEDYELEEAYMGDITARLLGEA